MITQEDVRRMDGCTTKPGCPQHPGTLVGHPPWWHVDVREELSALAIINEALERAVTDGWDGEESWDWIASEWVGHMATTHGADCPGRHCGATAEVPAYVEAIRRWYAESIADHGTRVGNATLVLRDLANELGVDLGV